MNTKEDARLRILFYLGNYTQLDWLCLNDNWGQLRCQLFLSRHTARTICLIRIAHSSVRQFEKHLFVFAQMNAARCIGGQRQKRRVNNKYQLIYKSQ